MKQEIVIVDEGGIKDSIKDSIITAPSVRGVKRWVRMAMRLGPGKIWNQKDIQETANKRISTLRKGRMKPSI